MLDIIVDTIVEYSCYGLFLTAFSGGGVFSSIVDGSVVGGLLLGGDRLFFSWASIDVSHSEQLNKRASNGTSSCQLKNAPPKQFVTLLAHTEYTNPTIFCSFLNKSNFLLSLSFHCSRIGFIVICVYVYRWVIHCILNTR